MVINHLANPAEESLKLCNHEISQLRVSIELDIEIFEDKNDFFANMLAELNLIKKNMQCGYND